MPELYYHITRHNRFLFSLSFSYPNACNSLLPETRHLSEINRVVVLSRNYSREVVSLNAKYGMFTRKYGYEFVGNQL